MSPAIAPIRRISLPDQIATVMRKEIFTGGYRPGDKLPAERELADKYGISRLTLRKALGMLSQEGWIEISQGRNIVVKDYRTSVGIEVLPDLFFACPEALLDRRCLETIVENTSRLSEQILVAAARQARPEDQERLLALLDRQTEHLSLDEFYENDFELAHEVLAIGGDLILQLAYNSQMKLSRRLLALGVVKDRPYPLARYHEINRSLIEAVCRGDEQLVRTLSRQYRSGLEGVFARSLAARREDGK
jgi:DNA-binding FadR family transcriptional regulator